MKDQEFLDLSDDLLDDATDAPVGEWDSDLMDEFPEDDPAAQDFSDHPAPESSKEDAKAKSSSGGKAKGDKAPKAKKRRKVRSGRAWGAGFFFFSLVLLAGLTLASGLMTAFGAAPESLLNFSGFNDPMTIGDFQAHPVNAFWLAVLVIVAAALVAALAVDRRLQGLTATVAAQDEVMEALRTLNPEDPESWKREELQNDPDMAAATSALLGHHNLQSAKLERYVGLEGELHRLEKAMSEDSTVDLNGSWENPSVGSLADQARRLLEARHELASNASERDQALEEQGPDLVAGIRDARSWNSGTLDKLNAQGASLENLTRHLAKLAEALPVDADRARRRDRVRQALEAVRQEIESLPARNDQQSAAEDSSVNALVERASRLAFQIAMEVARLGTKGERLLPLTQDLEELTTELRGSAEQKRTEPGQEDPRDKVLTAVRGRLAELDPESLRPAGEEEAATDLSKLAPVASQAAAGLAQIFKSFNNQTERLSSLLGLATELTGVQADVVDSATMDPATGNSLLVERFDPFGAEKTPEGGLVADPFASAGESIFSADQDNRDFGSSVLPGQEESVLSSSEPEPEVPEVAEPLAAAPPIPEVEPLPLEDEKVYDLSEFDAEPLSAEPGVNEAEDRIFDLKEFDAVRIG